LHWGYAEIAGLPVQTRRQFVEALERQLDYEKQELERVHK